MFHVTEPFASELFASLSDTPEDHEFKFAIISKLPAKVHPINCLFIVLPCHLNQSLYDRSLYEHYKSILSFTNFCWSISTLHFQSNFHPFKTF